MEAHRQNLPQGKPASTKLVAKGQVPTSGWRVRPWDRLGTQCRWHSKGTRGRNMRSAAHRGIRGGTLYASPVPKFLCQVLFPADISKPQCPIFQWKAPVPSELKYLLKPEKILCVPKQKPVAGAGGWGRRREGTLESGEGLRAGMLRWESGMVQWEGMQ